MTRDEIDPKGAIRAAEIAVGDEDLETALDALHEAKSRVMKLRNEEVSGDD